MIPRRAPDPEPVPQCGATFNEHRCTLDKDHEGWHQEWVERLVDTATWQDAPEVPKWSAEAAIARVRELHHSKLDRHPQGDVQRCIACLDLWPCPTIRAIEGGAE